MPRKFGNEIRLPGTTGIDNLPIPLKGNCSGKKIIFFIPSIDRVCGSNAQEKKSDFLHGSVRRYKTLRSSTNCGCGHLMTHFVGIAIVQQFIVVAFTCGVHC